MKTKYIIALVALAVAIVIGVAFIVYKNWEGVKNVYTKSKNSVKNKFAKIVPRKIKRVAPAEILTQVKDDPLLVEELAELNKEDIAAQRNVADVVKQTEQVVKQEAALKKYQATPVSSTITSATKYRKVADEKTASAKYNDILKRIETEKASGAVLLSAVRAEQLKTDKLKLMGSLDMETEYDDLMKIGTPAYVITKGDAEIFLKNNLTSV